MNTQTLLYILVFSGWGYYWLQTLVRGYKVNQATFNWGFFFKDNIMEFVSSLSACFLLLLLGMGVTPTDAATKLADFLLGLGSGSILNNLITTAKPEALTPTKP